MHRRSLTLLAVGGLLLGACTTNAQPQPAGVSGSGALLGVASATPSATPSPTSSPTASPTPQPPPALPLGALARVVVEPLQVHRSASASAAVVGELHLGELVVVAEGPKAAGGATWWHIRVAALDGWAAQGTTAHPSLVAFDSAAGRGWNVWGATVTTQLPAAVKGLPERVYVPNESSFTVSVIDPATMRVIDTLPTGRIPEHVTPDWNLSRFYVSNYGSPFLSTIDPRTGKAGAPVSATAPYNLYFTPDGSKAIVMAEDVNRIDFYDRATWKLLAQVPVPWAGIDHADFSAGGRFFVASTEYTGVLVMVDTVTMSIVGSINVGGLPIDVKLAPDGSVFYVANQGRGGVSVVDPFAMREIGFIPTGYGAHGMAISRDGRSLYVTNRMGGTISVIDFATRRVTATWRVGGSPDMLQVSTDGTQLWTGNRFSSYVSVIDTRSGRVTATIGVGARPHGLTFFPQPGRFSIGHNGVYR